MSSFSSGTLLGDIYSTNMASLFHARYDSPDHCSYLEPFFESSINIVAATYTHDLDSLLACTFDSECMELIFGLTFLPCVPVSIVPSRFAATEAGSTLEDFSDVDRRFRMAVINFDEQH
jgi:hypothetical protein